MSTETEAQFPAILHIIQVSLKVTEASARKTHHILHPSDHNYAPSPLDNTICKPIDVIAFTVES